MACVLTSGFTLDCKDSVGGIHDIWIIENSKISSATVSPTAGTCTALTLSTGTYFKYQLKKGTADLKIEEITSPINQSVFSKATLNIQLAKVDVAKRNEIRLLAQNTLSIIVKDRNAKYWLLGYENGCDLATASGEFGKAMGDFNGYNLTFEAEEKQAPYQLSDAVVTALSLT